MIDYDSAGNEIEKLSFSFDDDLVGFNMALDAIIGILRAYGLSEDQIENSFTRVNRSKVSSDHWNKIQGRVTQIREYS